MDMFASLIFNLSREYNINIGTIKYFYAGVTTFWSISPIPDVDLLPLHIQNQFLGAVAAKLTRGSSGDTELQSTVHEPKHQEDQPQVPKAVHPLLQGYETRRSRATSDGPVPGIASKGTGPYIAVLSSAHDPTARHLVRVGGELSLAVQWITYEYFSENLTLKEKIWGILSGANGIIVRNAAPINNSLLIAEASLCSSLPQLSNVISPSITSTNWSKPVQLRKLAQRGVCVPRTAIAMSAPRGLTITKGMGGVPTFATDMVTDRTAYPLMYQERQVGNEIRVHIIDGIALAHRIVSSRVDYREDVGACVTRCELLPRQLNVVENIAEMGEGRFSSVDLFENEKGTVVLEVNPMPGYHSYEGKEYEVSKALFSALFRSPLR